MYRKYTSEEKLSIVEGYLNGIPHSRPQNQELYLKYAKNQKRINTTKDSFWIFVYTERGHRSII